MVGFSIFQNSSPIIPAYYDKTFQKVLTKTDTQLLCMKFWVENEYSSWTYRQIFLYTIHFFELSGLHKLWFHSILKERTFSIVNNIVISALLLLAPTVA